MKKISSESIFTATFILFFCVWGWVNRDEIIPSKPVAINDVDVVRLAAFPSNDAVPIGHAYEWVSRNTAIWRAFDSPKGVRVVEVSGTILESSLADELKEDLYDRAEACRNLEEVVLFLGEDFSDADASEFHAAVVKPELYPGISQKYGFEDAAAAYRSANSAHFSSEISFKTQFVLKVDRSDEVGLGSRVPFSVGYSGITFSGGARAGEEIKHNELAERVAEI